MTALLAQVNPTPVVSVIPAQATSDEQLIELWLHGRSQHTQRAYRADAERFLRFIGSRCGR